MLFITPTGTFSQSDAVIEIGRALGGWLRAALLLKVVPKSLRDWAYRIIARNRYHWFGRHDQCLLPRPEWRRRFME